MQNKLSSFPRFLFPFSRIDSGNAWEKRKVSRRWISDRFGYADRLSRCIASQLQIRMTNDRCLVEPTGLSIFPSQKFIESPLSIDPPPPPPSPSRGSFYTISTRVRKRYIQKGRGLYCSVRPSSIVKRGTREK